MTAKLSAATKKHLEAYRFADQMLLFDELFGVLCGNLERAVVEHNLDESWTKHISAFLVLERFANTGKIFPGVV
jgi:hypothetical protein